MHMYSSLPAPPRELSYFWNNLGPVILAQSDPISTLEIPVNPVQLLVSNGEAYTTWLLRARSGILATGGGGQGEGELLPVADGVGYVRFLRVQTGAGWCTSY